MKRLAVILSALLVMIGCNKGQEQTPNPFFETWNTPYGVPPFESIKDYHYQPAFERAMSLHLEEIEAIVYFFSPTHECYYYIHNTVLIAFCRYQLRSCERSLQKK